VTITTRKLIKARAYPGGNPQDRLELGLGGGKESHLGGGEAAHWATSAARSASHAGINRSRGLISAASRLAVPSLGASVLAAMSLGASVCSGHILRRSVLCRSILRRRHAQHDRDNARKR
jgi:hypothetical protein